MVLPIITAAQKNRGIAIDLVARSAELTQKTRETIEMPEGPLKQEATNTLRTGAQEVGNAMRNLNKPSTAQHVVEKLAEMQSGADSRRRKSDAKLKQMEREAAESKLQLMLLKSEECRCRAAAEAFPELVKELLNDLKVADMEDLTTKQLNRSVVERVRKGFEQSAEAVALAVHKTEEHLERLEESIKDSSASEAYRREITSCHAHFAYHVACEQRVCASDFGEANSPTERIESQMLSASLRERTAIGLVNGLSMQVPRGSRLRPYFDYP